MNKIVPISLLFFLLGTVSLFAQAETETVLVAKDTTKLEEIDPLTPAKAAFYSAILPGLGQAYNKKYWKIPLVYGAMGTSLYFYLDSNKKYKEVRNEYKRRLEGLESDEKFERFDDDRLISAQKFYQRNRDLSALFLVAFYALNIIDANVDAHLIQFNVNEKLSLRPEIYPTDVTFRANVGLTFNYKF
ncbi:hypothetical protein GON26_09575 [Flavobacterium sp. GA093]|uniref:DUF5683 domain-containing protein n=1 Tax=Flavobacterium hydrocarbonoxydans TaxID=2683249 RepID=A0A6I4NKR7_9FLAO|nr:DUF5683 domain-containing protein [Flavobacterium hydrocarbonoxydans]MWB94613.1 hypothetical protein [Flavobacterium hydrocarbonoxydans]